MEPTDPRGLGSGGRRDFDDSADPGGWGGWGGVDCFGGLAVSIGSAVLITPAVPVGLPVVPRWSPHPVRSAMSAASSPGARAVPGGAAT
ncbi:hypothetical protein GCM10010236_58850 [Streptomyces eurythermus]|nr:hypothetical protein GCM10010236_58850 [Streptomyces eurythermus]